MLVASTSKGICHMAFADNPDAALTALKMHFPRACYGQLVDQFQQNAMFVFTQDWKKIQQVKLHLKGTAFQIKVWETLLKIPLGKLSTYGTIAKEIESPKAARAVGSAIGDNPVAYLIPCHRVIQSTGNFGEYHWGSIRKTAMIGWEAAHTINII
jgi:AraC family transcriptional regulator of adaptative response/methylated-DNA-[protein]-cysteine methyltransferase